MLQMQLVKDEAKDYEERIRVVENVVVAVE
jgi:hypothetical protein